MKIMIIKLTPDDVLALPITAVQSVDDQLYNLDTRRVGIHRMVDGMVGFVDRCYGKVLHQKLSNDYNQCFLLLDHNEYYLVAIWAVNVRDNAEMRRTYAGLRKRGLTALEALKVLSL